MPFLQDVQVAQPPQPPQPPGITIQRGGGRVTVQVPGGGNASDLFQAAVNRREVLRDTRRSLQEQREEISGQLQDPMVSGANRAGLEARVQQIDARIMQLDQQIAQADQEVAMAAGIPGARLPEPEPIRNGPPDGLFAIPIVFTLAVLMPLSIAWARRIWKRTTGAVAAAAPPHWMQERFGRLEQAVDAMALEVERISEGQRFLTKLFADGGTRALGQGAAQPIETPARERVAGRQE